MVESKGIKQQFEAFARTAHLDVLLPRSNDLTIHKILQEGSPEDVFRVPSRRNLFFGNNGFVNNCHCTHADGSLGG